VFDLTFAMKSVPFCFNVSSVACPECGSGIRVEHDLCLLCLLSQGIGVERMSVAGANDEALAELLVDMDGAGVLISR
jgi:hypothetical protein